MQTTPLPAIMQARKQAQAYYRLYHEHIPVAQLVREVAAVMQEYTREPAAVCLLGLVLFSIGGLPVTRLPVTSQSGGMFTDHWAAAMC